METCDEEMHIKLITNKPVSYRPRRYSDAEREKIRNIVNELLEQNSIRESTSPYASQVLLVKKKVVRNAYALTIGR